MRTVPIFVKEIPLTFTQPLKPLKEIKFIVIHHTEETGWDIFKTHQFHQEERKWSGIGYNFFIEKTGEVLMGRGYHIGAHAKQYNDRSLGICLTGNFDVELPAKEQLESVKELCLFLMKEFAIPICNVLGHCELEGVTKTCPGKNFNMGEFRESLREFNKWSM